MTTNLVNKTPYLRTTRDFTTEKTTDLILQISKMYIEVAGAVNQRVIGIYPVKKAAVNGKSFFFTSKRQEGFQQVYTFTSTSDINLGFKIDEIGAFTECYGTYLDAGGNIFGLPWGTSTPTPGLITFFIVPTASTTSDVIRFSVGAGAPALVSGTIILEWVADA